MGDMNRPAATPERRRRRPAVSCTLCRKRKIRCNRELPCSNCMRSRVPHTECVYDNPPPPAQARPSLPARPKPQEADKDIAPAPKTPHNISSLLVPTDASEGVVLDSSVEYQFPFEPVYEGQRATSGPSPSTQPKGDDVSSMKSRIAQLEDQLSQLRQSSTPGTSSTTLASSESQVEIAASSLDANRPAFHKSDIFGEGQFTSRSVMHKWRLFGQSHWVNSIAIYRDIFESFGHQIPNTTNLVEDIGKCKDLARVIKSRREPPWPTVPTTDLPPRNICDKLVDCYLRTSESVYRIMHIPSFRKDYEAMWDPQNEPDMSRIIHLKLILAIGTTTYDDEFSFRESATHWVHEAHSWLGRPEFKIRVRIKFIQTYMLLIIAREVVGVGSSLTWTSMGELLRLAIYAGLHRDPSRLPRRTTIVSELRRRLWNTLLEMDLHACLCLGGAPLMGVDGFDTQPPGNFDDEQITQEDPEPKPDQEFTQMSIPRALRHTYPVRLSIAKFLNELTSKGTYRETLQLDTQLRAAYRPVNQMLQGWKRSASTTPSPSPFQEDFADTIVRRTLLSLHVPFYGPSLNETAYAFTRKVVVDTCLILWRNLYIPSSPTGGLSHPEGRDMDFALFHNYRGGNFRPIAMHVAQLLMAEVKTQIRENDVLGDSSIRSDLMSIMSEGKDWALQCIKMGETNIKGYMLLSMITAQVHGLMRGMQNNELSDVLIHDIEASKNICMPILEERAALGENPDTLSNKNKGPLYQDDQFMADWDFSIQNNDFSWGVMDPANWVFDSDSTQMPVFLT